MNRSQRYACNSVEPDGKMCVVRVRASPHPYNTPLILLRLRLNGTCSARPTPAAASKGKSATATKGGPRIGGTKEKAPARRRGKPIEVWVTDEEKAAIKESADEAGMSRSGYLRALGLNTPIRSVVDLTAVADLAKVNGDLWRVAGLLKLWLAEKNGQGAEPVDVEKMMVDFRVLQAQVRGLMSRIVYDRR